MAIHQAASRVQWPQASFSISATVSSVTITQTKLAVSRVGAFRVPAEPTRSLALTDARSQITLQTEHRVESSSRVVRGLFQIALSPETPQSCRAAESLALVRR